MGDGQRQNIGPGTGLDLGFGEAGCEVGGGDSGDLHGLGLGGGSGGDGQAAGGEIEGIGEQCQDRGVGLAALGRGRDLELEGAAVGLDQAAAPCPGLDPEPQAHAAGDFALLDPPRAGAGVQVIERLAAMSPSVLTYVSCDPATLARDLRLLVDYGYLIDSITALDMFPQTFHVETVVRLRIEDRFIPPARP